MDEINIKDVYARNNYMYMAIIELTTNCNFRCKHCFIEQHDKDGLSCEEIFNLLKQLRDFGVYEVQFTGGEIFTRKDIMPIIRYARTLKFKVAILTNASLLTDAIISELNSLYVEVVSTTLFSLSNEINDKITSVQNSSSKVVENILKLSKTSMRSEIKTIVMRDNANEYQDIQNFCICNNIHYTATEGLFPTTNGNDFPRHLKMDYDQLCRNIGCLDKIRFGNHYKEEKLPDDPICCELHYSLFIDANGDVYPCNLWFKKLGNIKSSDISDIWNTPFLNLIRNTTWKDLPVCSSCENSAFCIRCSGIVDTLKGNYLLEDPYACRTASARHKIQQKDNLLLDKQ